MMRTLQERAFPEPEDRNGSFIGRIAQEIEKTVPATGPDEIKNKNTETLFV